ncbi:MAG TPA: PAS domain S-box protein, partial [Actinomycetota bacterium]|nr:PAS domain S-box protein [Actinomycetota bacterium]
MAEPDTDPVDERSARRVSASLHDLLFDRYADAVFVADAGGRYVEANLAAAALLGYSRAEILDRSIPDLVVGSERAEADFARFGAEGYWRGQVELRRKDGSTVAVEARATMLETADGTLAVSILRESADPLEAALAASEAQFQAIVRSSNDAIFSEDPEGRIRTWNRAAERMFGYTESEIVGQHVSVLAPPERRDEVQDNFERVWRGELVEHYETTRLAKDGRRVEVSLSVSPIKGADGTLTGIVAIARDVGDRHEAERRAHVLYELTHLLGRAASPDEVFDASMDALQRALHTDRASVLLFDDERVMRFRAWRGLSPSYRAAVEGHNPWSLEDRDPHPIHVPDVVAAPALEEVRGVIVHEGIRALTFVPLLHAGTLIGKFMLYFDAPRSL